MVDEYLAHTVHYVECAIIGQEYKLRYMQADTVNLTRTVYILNGMKQQNNICFKLIYWCAYFLKGEERNRLKLCIQLIIHVHAFITLMNGEEEQQAKGKHFNCLPFCPIK